MCVCLSVRERREKGGGGSRHKESQIALVAALTKMELIQDSCINTNNPEVALGIWGRCMVLDHLYFLGFHTGWKPSVHLQLFSQSIQPGEIQISSLYLDGTPKGLYECISWRQKGRNHNLFRDKKTGVQRGHVIYLWTQQVMGRRRGGGGGAGATIVPSAFLKRGANGLREVKANTPRHSW